MEKNILPGNVKMTGDARALSKETNENASKMLQIVEGIMHMVLVEVLNMSKLLKRSS